MRLASYLSSILKFLTNKNFISYKMESHFIEKTIRISIISFYAMCYIIGGISLSLVICFVDFGYNDFFDFYIPNYPHIVWYTIAFFWFPILPLSFAVWKLPYDHYSMKRIIFGFSAIIILSTIISYTEQTSDHMMVFEFNKETQEKYCMKDRIKSKIQKDDIQFNSIVKSCEKGNDVSNDELFSFDFWSDKENVFSTSRIFYTISVFCIIFVMLSSWAMITLLPKKSSENRSQILAAISLSGIGLLFWIPFRAFYNANTKSNVFENTAAMYNSLAGPDFLIIIITIIVLVYIVVEILQINPNLGAGIIGVFGFFGFSTAIVDPSWVPVVFGLYGEKQMWVFWISLLVFASWFVYAKRN